MSLDALFDRARHDKLRIANLVQGTHGLWHCYVYRKTRLHGVGIGTKTPEEALKLALDGHSYIEKAPEPVSVADQFADILG
ncbi:MAG: hypothetical protein DI537_20280 [Stutzerimonas stutzeri]|nr:MAG: hypothetical protein DI537_20280 [Stutzerimonas stutzeri]